MENHITPKNNSAKVLVKEAEVLFAQHGYKGTSVRMIAEMAGISTASINYHFGSKEGLYHEIFQQHIKALNNNLDKIESMQAGAMEKLNLFLDIFLESVQENKNFHRILFREIYQPDQESKTKKLVRSSMKAHFEMLKNIIQAGIQKGVFKKINEHFFALSVFTLIPPLTINPPLIDQLGCQQKGLTGDKGLKEELKDYFNTIILSASDTVQARV